MSSVTSPAAERKSNGFHWTFYRIGGLDQVALRTTEELQHLADLDPKLWVALSCPVAGIELDARTLALVDTDGDGRIRVPEILAAVKWACDRLTDPASLAQRMPALPLNLIRNDSEEGRNFIASARRILLGLGKPDADRLGQEDVANAVAIAAKTPLNGDGIMPVESAADDQVKQLIRDILDTVGGKTDAGGQPGADLASADIFFGQLQAYADWWSQTEADKGTLPLGDATPVGYAVMNRLRAKAEDFFTRCQLAEFDSRATPLLNRAETDLMALATNELTTNDPQLAALPLARVEPARALPLTGGINPAWAELMAEFHATVVTPPCGATQQTLTRADWLALTARFAGYAASQSSKPVTPVEKLGINRIRELLGDDTRQRFAALVQQDCAVAPEMKAIADVERLVLYHRHLHRLLMNFVSFTEFYDTRAHATFQAGQLYLDGRCCSLCVRVQDSAKHATIATLSKLYLAYCDCTRKDQPGKITIAAAFTAGDSDYLLAGRNGVFIDSQGRDWDATIVKVMENPISIRQAALSPYKRMARMIGDQIEKLAAAREKEVQESTDKGIAGAADATKAAPPNAKPPVPFDIGKTVGIFAAIGLAIGAIGTALAAILKSFLGLNWWQMPLALVGVFLLISGPSMIIAWIKLRQRTLGPVLDASGWAINGRVRINFLLGHALTTTAALPKNATRSLDDPFGKDKHARQRRAVLLWLLLLSAIATGTYWALRWFNLI